MDHIQVAESVLESFGYEDYFRLNSEPKQEE